MTSEFLEDAEEFDETDNAEKLSETLAELNQIDNNSTPLSNQTVDKRYNFDKTTILLGLQILPTSEITRKVLISCGVVGAPPIMSSTTLAELEQIEAIAFVLTKLKESLPQIAASAQQRREAQPELQLPKQKQRVPLPELPSTNSIPTTSTNQLSLF